MKQITPAIILYMTVFLCINVSAQNKTPELAFSYLKSKNNSINELKGNIVVINIWSPDYLYEINVLNKLAEKYKDNKVIFLAITDEAYESTIPFLENELFSYQYLAGDEAKKIFDKYQTSMFKTFPIHIIINQEGKIVFKKKGTRRNIEKSIEKRINALLNQQQSNEKTIPKDQYCMK